MSKNASPSRGSERGASSKRRAAPGRAGVPPVEKRAKGSAAAAAEPRPRVARAEDEKPPAARVAATEKPPAARVAAPEKPPTRAVAAAAAKRPGPRAAETGGRPRRASSSDASESEEDSARASTGTSDDETDSSGETSLASDSSGESSDEGSPSEASSSDASESSEAGGSDQDEPGRGGGGVGGKKEPTPATGRLPTKRTGPAAGTNSSARPESKVAGAPLGASARGRALAEAIRRHRDAVRPGFRLQLFFRGPEVCRVVSLAHTLVEAGLAPSARALPPGARCGPLCASECVSAAAPRSELESVDAAAQKKPCVVARLVPLLTRWARTFESWWVEPAPRDLVACIVGAVAEGDAILPAWLAAPICGGAEDGGRRLHAVLACLEASGARVALRVWAALADEGALVRVPRLHLDLLSDALSNSALPPAEAGRWAALLFCAGGCPAEFRPRPTGLPAQYFLARLCARVPHLVGANLPHFAVASPAILRFVSDLATSATCRRKLGRWHVFLRLYASEMHTTTTELSSFDTLRGLEALHAPHLIANLRGGEDVDDLCALGWRPHLAMFLTRTLREPHVLRAAEDVGKMAPVVWESLNATFSRWLDAPHAASTALLPLRVLGASYLEWLGRDAGRLGGTPAGVSEYLYEATAQLVRNARWLEEPGAIGKWAGRLLPPRELQQMLAIVHRSPRYVRYAWLLKSLAPMGFIILYRRAYFQPLMQVLLQPGEDGPSCGCLLAQAGRTHRRSRLSMDADAVPHSHGCTAEISTPLIGLMCRPWYRRVEADEHAFAAQVDGVLEDGEVITNAFGLNSFGRPIALAHLIMVLAAKGIPATRLLFLVDIVGHLGSRTAGDPASRALHLDGRVRRPEFMKAFRTLLARMNEFTALLLHPERAGAEAVASPAREFACAGGAIVPESLPRPPYKVTHVLGDMPASENRDGVAGDRDWSAHLLARPLGEARLAGLLERLHWAGITRGHSFHTRALAIELQLIYTDTARLFDCGREIWP
jgi:hypothetical protein